MNGVKKTLLVFFLINFCWYPLMAQFDATKNSPFKDSDLGDWTVIASAIGTRIFYGVRDGKSNNRDPKFIKDTSKLPFFDKIENRNYSVKAGTTSDWFLRPSIAGLMFSGGVYEKQGYYLGLQTLAITDMTNLFAKHIVKRKRPFTREVNELNLRGARCGCFKYDSRAKDAELSFYSGHTAQVAAFSYFTMTMLWLDNGTDNDWVYMVGGALPAITGYLRVRAGKHFLSDVLIGYAMGAATGYLVPKVHRDKSENLTTNQLNIKLETAMISGAGTLAALLFWSKISTKKSNRKNPCNLIAANNQSILDKITLRPQFGAISGFSLKVHL